MSGHADAYQRADTDANACSSYSDGNRNFAATDCLAHRG